MSSLNDQSAPIFGFLPFSLLLGNTFSSSVIHLRQMQRKTAAVITTVVQSCPIVAEAPLLVRDLECELAAEVGVTVTLPRCDGLDEGRLDLVVPTSACDVTLEVDSAKTAVAVLGAEFIHW